MLEWCSHQAWGPMHRSARGQAASSTCNAPESQSARDERKIFMIVQLRTGSTLWFSILILPVLAIAVWAVMLPTHPVQERASISIDALHRGAPLDLPSATFEAN
jgi:hypothetical protein